MVPAEQSADVGALNSSEIKYFLYLFTNTTKIGTVGYEILNSEGAHCRKPSATTHREATDAIRYTACGRAAGTLERTPRY